MKYFLLIFLILVMSITNATRVDLLVGESYADEGRNITLSAIDSKGNKALFCVNNQKAIIPEDEQKTVNEVGLSVKSISRDKVRVNIDVYCEDCECDENCLNKDCIIDNTEKTVIEEELVLDENEEKIFLQAEGVEVIENPGLSTGNITLALIILVLFTVGLYHLVKK